MRSHLRNVTSTRPVLPSCAMLNALVSDFARGLPLEYAEALNSQLQGANDAEVEAFWWAQAAKSNRNLLLYLLQSRCYCRVQSRN
jgi:hypothetical protein